jgi:hypothetical protein
MSLGLKKILIPLVFSPLLLLGCGDGGSRLAPESVGEGELSVELRSDGVVAALSELDEAEREEYGRTLAESLDAVEPRPSPEAIASCVDDTIGVDGTTPLQFVQPVAATDSSFAALAIQSEVGEPSRLIVVGQTSATLGRAEYEGIAGDVVQDGEWALIVVELESDPGVESGMVDTRSFDESAVTLTDESGKALEVTPKVLCHNQFG